MSPWDVRLTEPQGGRTLAGRRVSEEECGQGVFYECSDWYPGEIIEIIERSPVSVHRKDYQSTTEGL